MANEALIQGAKYAYGAGTQAAAGMRQANIQAKYGGRMNQTGLMQAKAKRKAQERESEATIAKYVDSIPADFDVSQIPSKYRGVISEKLLAMKQEAAQAAQDITNYNPGEQGYQMNVDIINNVKNAMNNMEQQFTGFGNDKVDFLKDSTNKSFSAANDPEGKMASLSSLYTDNLDLRIGDDGNLFFSGDGVDEFNFNTANQDAPFVKANTQAKQFLELNKSIYNSGKDISNAEKLMHGNQINNMLDDGGWQVSQSFLADDLFGTPLNQQIGKVTIEGQEYSLDEAMAMANDKDSSLNMDAREAINDEIKNTLMGHLNTSATNGKTAKNGEGTGDNFEFDGEGGAITNYRETITVDAVDLDNDGTIDREASEYQVFPTVEHRTSTNKELRLQDNRYVVYDTSLKRGQSSISMEASQEEINKFLKRHFKV